MDRENGDGLDGLRAAIAACRLCRDHPARGISDRLPHEPHPVAVLSTTARILIAGQAPGLRVHQSGLPFNDASGDRLRDWLGVDRETFYDATVFAIAPMGFCFPGYDAKGSDLPPRRECAPRWRTEVTAAMPQIALVLAVGRHAQAYHLDTRMARTVSETVARFREYDDDGRSLKVLPLPHPSWRNTGWLKAHPWFAQDFLPVLKQRVAEARNPQD